MEQYLHLPVQASAHAAKLDQLNAILHWLMLILFVGWGLFFVFTLFRFRAGANPKADYVGVKSHLSTYLEVGVAIFEVVLLIGFSIPLWAARVSPTELPMEKDAVVVKVMAEQFAWNIHYAGADGVFGKQDIKLVSSENPMGMDKNDTAGKDDVTAVNQLHMVVNKPVIVYLTSKDVIHSFALQQMRVKQDAIPGSNFPLWFIPTKTTAEIREEMVLTVPAKKGSVPQGYVAMEDYDNDGTTIVKKLQPVTDKVLDQLIAAGIKEIRIAAEVPTEITCAQLCGLGHYRMRGTYVVETQAEFDDWMKKQAAASSGGSSSYE